MKVSLNAIMRSVGKLFTPGGHRPSSTFQQQFKSVKRDALARQAIFKAVRSCQFDIDRGRGREKIALRRAIKEVRSSLPRLAHGESKGSEQASSLLRDSACLSTMIDQMRTTACNRGAQPDAMRRLDKLESLLAAHYPRADAMPGQAPAVGRANDTASAVLAD